MGEWSKQAHLFVGVSVRDSLVGFTPLKFGIFYEDTWRTTKSILDTESILAR